MCEHSLVVIFLCLYRNGFTNAPKWNWYVQNARFTTDTLRMQTAPYNLSGLAAEGILSYFPNTFIHITTLKGWISVDLEIMLYFHEFCSYKTLDDEAKKWVCRKERWGVQLIFIFLVKWNQHISSEYYLLKAREKSVIIVSSLQC
jgi:hypothetical protein